MQLRDLAIAGLLLVADGHAAVVEHAAEVIFEGKGFLGCSLGEDVVGVLEVGELGAGLGDAGFAGVEDFGAEFGAGGAEEVGFLFEGVSWWGGNEDGGRGKKGGGLHFRRRTWRRGLLWRRRD